MDLGFDDHGAAAKRLGMGTRLIGRERYEAARHGHTVSSENGFALVLMNLHTGQKVYQKIECGAENVI